MVSKAQVVNDLQNIFAEDKLYPDMFLEGNKLTICIEWGDWKHDHLYVDRLVDTYFKESPDFELISSDKVVTDEDSSDTYSADHIFTFARRK